MQDYFILFGEVDGWPSKQDMAEILRDADLRIYVGQYSIRILACEHFVFQEYGRDLGDPSIDADAESLKRMLADGMLVSDALADADIRHRFEIYCANQEQVGYLHHRWPEGDSAL
ncbi:hypothetical protein [Aeoliella mucimassa]|uniref:Uncharacterized protein n=1 Tax=Aeoliella mucimassa TaxID=2527972 RepID=A0A518AJB0_9BACT|nr:hypothetical protein [Aeoliella mucimassa]QDU54800.1 hypothetical protein Pan181_09830 [Aeoliella mucimassa]